MPRTRRQSTPSHSGSEWDSDSDASVLFRSPSPDREPPEHIPRPPNRFILYRAHVWMERKEQLEQNKGVETMADFGRYVGPKWRSEPQEVKDYWDAKAAEAKREHEAKYPDYEFRPNRGSKREKRAPHKPQNKTTERKAATLSPTQRTMKTRSMSQQRQAAATRTSAQERKADAEGRRGTTTPPGDPRQTRSITRTGLVQLVEADVAQPEDVQSQSQNTSVMGWEIDQEDVVQPHPAGGEILPSTAGLLPVGGGISTPRFDLPVGGGVFQSRFDLLPELGDPVVDQALPIYLQATEAVDENFAPSESEEHDRPSLWDSDLPLFPREILEEGDYSDHYEARGVPRDWSDWLPRQATFLADFGSDPLQPLIDPLLANWPNGGQYLGQHLEPFPEPQGWNAYA